MDEQNNLRQEQPRPENAQPQYGQPQYQQYQQQQYGPQYGQPPQVNINYGGVTRDQLPAQFRPLSAWAYFGYGILFAIPVVGFICLIVFSISDANINRRSFARSYWCWYIIAVAAVLVLALTGDLAYLSVPGYGYYW